MPEEFPYQPPVEQTPGVPLDNVPNTDTSPPVSMELFGNFLDFADKYNQTRPDRTLQEREATRITIGALQADIEAAATAEDPTATPEGIVEARFNLLTQAKAAGRPGFDTQLQHLAPWRRLLASPDASQRMQNAINTWNRAQQAAAAQQAARRRVVKEAGAPQTSEAASTQPPAKKEEELDESVLAARRMLEGIKVSGKTQEQQARAAETKRGEPSPLVQEVLDAVKANRTAVISMDTPSGLPVRRGSGRVSTGGLKVFGDGATGSTNDVPKHFRYPIGQSNRIKQENPNMGEVDGWSLEDVKDMVEAVAFVPATGGVLLSYAYKPALLGDAHQVENRLGLPPYKSSEAPLRSGANLVVQVLLPESLATDLRQGLEAAEASKDPRKIQEQTELFRTMVQEVVINCGGVSRGAWENGVNLGLGDERRSSRLKPPYEELPPTHRMFLVEPKTDKNDRQFMVARRIGEPVS